ncbi:hypothetical protein [Desulfoplanes formicivorans]|nr:hypothetical protein [Desulfoplanes formicivorans]
MHYTHEIAKSQRDDRIGMHFLVGMQLRMAQRVDEVRRLFAII